MERSLLLQTRVASAVFLDSNVDFVIAVPSHARSRTIVDFSPVAVAVAVAVPVPVPVPVPWRRSTIVAPASVIDTSTPFLFGVDNDAKQLAAHKFVYWRQCKVGGVISAVSTDFVRRPRQHIVVVC
jgi:hypothetical protein